MTDADVDDATSGANELNAQQQHSCSAATGGRWHLLHLP